MINKRTEINHMQISEVRVNWHEGYANSPTFEVIVEGKVAASASAQLFRKHPVLGLYYAQDDVTGLVKFFAYDKPGQGYGGSRFELPMEDGSIAVLHGPWSSRAGVMNKYFDGVACVDVTLKSDPTPCEWLEGGIGYSNLAGALTLAKLLEWMTAHRDGLDFWVCKVTRSDDEVVYEPCHSDGLRKSTSTERGDLVELV